MLSPMGRLHRQVQGGRNGNRSLTRKKGGRDSRAHMEPKSKIQLTIYTLWIVVQGSKSELTTFNGKTKTVLFKDLV